MYYVLTCFRSPASSLSLLRTATRRSTATSSHRWNCGSAAAAVMALTMALRERNRHNTTV